MTNQVEAAVALSKAQILEDIGAGVVPADVATFSELHDYVDANEYGGLCEDDNTFSHEESLKVQALVNRWLAHRAN